MYSAGREWIGIERERTVLDWTGLDWTGADSTEWTEPHVSGVDRTGLSRTALQKTELDGMHFTGLDCLTLSLTSLDCTTLHYPGLNWKVPYRTVSSLHLARLICTELHSTFPNETDKDCTALYMNVS